MTMEKKRSSAFAGQYLRAAAAAQRVSFAQCCWARALLQEDSTGGACPESRKKEGMEWLFKSPKRTFRPAKYMLSNKVPKY